MKVAALQEMKWFGVSGGGSVVLTAGRAKLQKKFAGKKATTNN